MLIRPDPDERDHPWPTDILLVVEVSHTTLRFDRITKAAPYAAANIPEYWIYVVTSRQFVVHRQPSPSGYADVLTYEAGQPVAPLALPVCLVDPGNLAGN